MVQTRTEFEQPINLKSIIIIGNIPNYEFNYLSTYVLEGLICLVILFACGISLYLCLKVK